MNALNRFQLGKWLFGVFAVALACSSAFAQEGVDGPLTVTAANTVLNQYATLAANAAVGATSFSVTSIADLSSTANGALAAGDLVMLYQAQGATINTADSSSFGAVTDLGSAGRYEVITVGSVSGNTITLDASCGGLDFSYATTGNTQVVRIPQYTTLTVNSGASVTGTAWNGVRGGIVAVQAQSVVMNGTVTANALGFRGGAVDNFTSTAGGASVTIYRSTANTSGAEKGESIAGSQATYDGLNGRYGRGAPANGGGGGNGHNAGGGGGANGNNGNAWSGQGVMSGTVTGATAWALDPGYVANGNARTNSSGGGRGGYTYSSANLDALTVAPGTTTWGGDFRRELGGLGGRPLDNDTATRLFFGGGGGAGDANNTSGGAGGAGGGMVFIISGTVSGSGTVSANGAAGASSNNTFNGAPGGGGGGGTVVVRATTLSGVGIQASGGVGGTQPITSAEAEGPGGGGGGGFIATSGGTVTQTAVGGANGVTNSSSLTEFPTNGATVGATGQTNASASGASVCTVASLATVSGSVFGDTDRNGARGTGETNFTGGTLTLTLTNTTTGATLTTTTTTGAYSFSNVPVGTYTVTTSVPSGTFVSTAARTVTVSSSVAGTTTVQDIGLAQNLTPPACSVTYAGGVTTSPYTIFPLNTDGTVNTGLASFSPTISGTAVQTAAFARDPITNRLYYIELEAGNSARVGYYDFVTGQKTDTGLTITKATSDQGVANNNFTRFAFNAAGVGYASISATNSVYRITTSPFTATYIGNISSTLQTGLSGDFAITSANRAWLSANGEVYRINLNDSSLPAVVVVNTSNATANGVAFTSNGTLLISDATTTREVNLATLAFGAARTMTGQPNNSADLANCVNPTLEPNLSVVKSVTPSGSVAPGTELTYTLTATNSGTAVAVNSTLTDAIPANTTYVPGSTMLNGAVVADAPDGGDADTLADMPYVTAREIHSPVSGTTTYGNGIVSTTAPAVVTFRVRVNNPFPSTAASVTNQGFAEYDSGSSDTRVVVPSTPSGGGTGGTTVTVGNRDFGDAPDTASGTAAGNYQTLGSDNGPSHTIVSGLRLGTVVGDADDGTLQDAAAAADDIGNTDDEDGVASFPYVGVTSGQTVTVPVSVTNSTGAAATLVGYLDFNKDGDFLDTGEQSASVSVANGATSATVVFTTPAGLTAGTTYARFRLGSVSAEVTAAFGAASSGEVEDYLVSIGAPDLSVAKTSSSLVRGTTGTYTISVTNGGNLATNAVVTVTDVLPAGLTFVSATGTDWTCSYNTTNRTITCTRPAGSPIAAETNAPPITLTVSVDQSASGTIRNTANVSGGGEVNTTNNAGFVDTTFTSQADLAISKTGTASVNVGGTVSYTLTVTNTGPSNVTGAIITDPVPNAVTGVTWTCAATGTASCGAASGGGNAISLTGNLNAGAGNSLTITVTGTASTGGPITNTASVAAPSGTTDPAAGNNSSSQNTIISPSADLAITKTGPTTATVGQSVSYTLSVRNNGPSPAGGTTFSDPVPSNLTGVTAVCGAASGGTAGCAVNVSGNSVTGSVATLPSGGVQVITVTGTASTAGTLRNTATLTPPSGTVDPVMGNNTSFVDTTVQTAPDLTLVKADTGDFTVGGTGTYSFTVTNAGGSATSGLITVTDTLPTGLRFVAGSATGAGWNCSADALSPQTVTCTNSVAIAPSGSSTFTFSVNVGVGTAVPSVTNTASVSGGGDTTPSSASDVTTVLSPDLTVAKTHTPTSFVRGSTGTYSITVQNSGTAPTSAQTTVIDTLPTGLSVSAGTFTPSGVNGSAWSCTASGQTVTCVRTAAIPITAGSNSSTFSFPVSVAASAAPSVTNEARVSGGNEATANVTPYSAATPSNTARDVTPTVDAGTLTLSKTVRNVTRNGPVGVVSSGEPGDVLEYCISYTNPGGSDVSSAVLTDNVPLSTTALTTPYAGAAIQWTITAPAASVQNLSAATLDDAGELGTALTVRLGTIPAAKPTAAPPTTAGAGKVCFQVTIR